MTRRTWIAALPILVAMSGSAVRSQEKPIAIVGGRLIDGTGAPPVDVRSWSPRAIGFALPDLAHAL